MELWIGKRNDSELTVRLSRDPSLEDSIQRMRQLHRRRWEPELRAWIIPYTFRDMGELLEKFDHADLHADDSLLEECQWLCDRIEEREAKALARRQLVIFEESQWGKHAEELLSRQLRLRGYSSKTITAYCGQVRRFYDFYEKNRELSMTELIPRYCNGLLRLEFSHSYVNQALSSVKFYLEKVCGLKAEPGAYIRPKKEKKLPDVLSAKEVMRLFAAVSNPKHRAILVLTYSSGLRVSEVVRLRMADIDRDRKTLLVRQGKGRKDRQTLLSEAAYATVLAYVKQEKPGGGWLFPGADSNRHLTERTIQKVFEQSVKKAEIRKNVSVHSLRHSFATHLLEGGIDIRYIQQLLGHKNVATTEIYTHVAIKDVSRIQSPLDRMIDRE
ncbi:site-specific tyrosine recombinase/integron integrase [Cohnella suwonensis]|uniref:Site-specific tyrosine recombinase/integron integrase n=1 Tax=Cohnella suwonensis TaxID=696072 RepID=A0ABW0M3G3_9BACL